MEQSNVLAEKLHQFFRGFLNGPKCINCPLCSLSRCTVVRNSPVGHLPAELIACSLMAHTSVMLLLERHNLEDTGMVIEEGEQCRHLGTLLVFPVFES